MSKILTNEYLTNSLRPFEGKKLKVVTSGSLVINKSPMHYYNDQVFTILESGLSFKVSQERLYDQMISSLNEALTDNHIWTVNLEKALHKEVENKDELFSDIVKSLVSKPGFETFFIHFSCVESLKIENDRFWINDLLFITTTT